MVSIVICCLTVCLCRLTKSKPFAGVLSLLPQKDSAVTRHSWTGVNTDRFGLAC